MLRINADWQQRRNIFGLPVEKFHQPVALWHPSGHYIIAAAAHGYVYVFHVGTAKVMVFSPDAFSLLCSLLLIMKACLCGIDHHCRWYAACSAELILWHCHQHLKV